MKQYAVITGASQGLGKEFALELAKRKYNLLLVSLPNENLPQLCGELAEEYQIDAIPFEHDLSATENVIQLTQEINSKYNVELLINNVGIGGTKRFDQIDFGYVNRIIQLNIAGTTAMTHQLLPNLLKQPKGHILNISSLAALSPIGFKTVYPASKAFIRHFSFGLREELRGTNVTVSIVNPGAMATNPEVTKRINSQGKIGQLTVVPLEKIAKVCVDGMLKGKKTIVINRLSWLFMKLIPMGVKTRLITNGVRKELPKGFQ